MTGKIAKPKAAIYKSGTLVTSITTDGAEYTVLYDGYIEGNVTGSAGDGRIAQVVINNVMVAGVGGANGSSIVYAVGVYAPISVGDVIKTRSGIGIYTLNVYKYA